MHSIEGKDSEISPTRPPTTSETVTIVEAAGGAVVDSRGRVLVMLRRGVWDLPKGHREEGETFAECAARECAEECGLDAEKLAVGEEIARTRHTYWFEPLHRHEEKYTVWFRILYRGDPGEVSPERDEGITALEWVSVAEARRRAEGSYATIREVLSKL